MIKILRRSMFLAVLGLLSFHVMAQNPALVWSDEFSGSALDATKWQAQIGDGCQEGICGWGNGELQYYRAENAVVRNGMLEIIAKRERVQSKAYTSARIRTKNLADFKYGRFEARIKLPAGAGLWPAFWMLSTDEPNGGWPMDGEIDIMEFISAKPDHVFGTIHYGDPFPNNQFQGNDFYLYDGSKFTDDFHVFAIEWEPGIMRWYVDDILYSVKTPEDIAPFNWPFDASRFHFILNVAVGGTLGGTVDNTIFPSTMLVDYVRVFDGPKPSLRGARVVSNQAQGLKYHLDKVASNVNVNWTVPAGATIVSGQGSREITVNFGSNSGKVVANFNAGSGSQSLPMDVLVEPPYSKDFVFENFDSPGQATFASSDGTLTKIANPAPNTVNSSAMSGKYDRNGQTQYDVIFYNTSAISNASQYSKVGADKKFYMDVLTSAPIGTEIIVQLETSTATATNYPTGRHSRYRATVRQNGAWHRLEFAYMDRPDAGASNTVSKIAVLFNPNSFTSHTYNFDNFDSYKAGEAGSTPNQPPTVSITSPSNGSSFAQGSTITVSASASDADGTVARVEFFANGTSIGIDHTAPYSVSWVVPAGTNSLTAVATDNEGASTTSAVVSVTGTTSSAQPTSMYVSSVVVGTINAGGGSRFGSATVTILDNLNNPVSGALVSGTFSGSFNESVSGTTGSNGQVVLRTSTTARGGVTVNFCVNNVSGSLPYDPSLNSGNFSCSTGSGNREMENGVNYQDEGFLSDLVLFPNPVRDFLTVQLPSSDGEIQVRIIDMNGRLIWQGSNLNEPLDVSGFGSGIYLLEVQDKDQVHRKRFIK